MNLRLPEGPQWSPQRCRFWTGLKEGERSGNDTHYECRHPLARTARNWTVGNDIMGDLYVKPVVARRNFIGVVGNELHTPTAVL